jgi:hypothetical protein
MRKSIALTTAALVLFAFGWILALQSDITGTWVGETAVPDALEPDILTLVLETKEGKLVGKVSDSMGYAEDTECLDIKYEKNELTFYFEITDGYDVQPIYISLKIEGDSMVGTWANDAGEGAEVTLKKKQ